jgi:parallel beta-helix repeat protein
MFNTASVEPVITVAPSGDAGGVTDAAHIEDALNAAKATGGSVRLAAGHYYVSRNIVVVGFQGTLMGEGMDETIIEAVRGPHGGGFSPAPSLYFPGPFPDLPTLLQFDYPVGDVTIRNLTVQVVDPQPADAYTNPLVSSGYQTTGISTLIEILGGDHNTVVENVRFRGAPGDARGSNVAFGIHVMLGDTPTPGDVGTGDLRFTKVVAEDIGWYALLVMRFESSAITIEDSRVANAYNGLYVGPVLESSVSISNVDISNSVWGMWFAQIPSGLEVRGNRIEANSTNRAGIRLNLVDNAMVTANTIRGGQALSPTNGGIRLWRSHNNTIADNRFEELGENAVGIRLFGFSSGNDLHHNDYKMSGLTAPTGDYPYGPAAVFLWGNTYDNRIFEMKFPADEGKTLCHMIRDVTDNPTTTTYDGTNDIHDWRPCENLAERDARKDEPESEPQGIGH